MRALITINYASHDLISKLAPQWTKPGDDAHVFVVDNWSSSANRREIARVCDTHGFTLVASPDNRGFGAGCNQGAAAATARGARTIMLVNPDVAITPDVVGQICETVESEQADLASPRLVGPNGEHHFNGFATSLKDGATCKPGTPGSFLWLTGAAQAMTAATYMRLGGYDEDYFMYWEDVDLGYRAERLGLRSVVRSDVTAQHFVGGTQSDSAGEPAQNHVKSPLYIEHNCRGRLLFARKHLDAEQHMAWRRTAPAYAAQVVMRSGGRRYLAHPASLAAAWRGTWAGLHGAWADPHGIGAGEGTT